MPRRTSDPQPQPDRKRPIRSAQPEKRAGASQVRATLEGLGNRAAARVLDEDRAGEPDRAEHWWSPDRRPAAAAPAGSPGAAVLQRQEENWAKATYPSAKACMEDHFRRHPSSEWSNVQEYTDKAIEVLNANYNRATKHTLKDGSKGWKIRTSDYFGIYTNDDKIVTFGER